MTKIKKPLLYDIFCGAGGATRGYQKAGFYVVGIDHEPQPHYCGDDFIQMDALEFLEQLIDGLWPESAVNYAGPPCQAYTGMRNITLSRFGHAPKHPDLIDPTRQLLRQINTIYVIENVQNAPLQTQVILCGASLGLPHLARHRHFESNFFFFGPPRCSHLQNKYTIGVYGSKPDGRRVSYPQHRLSRIANCLEEGQQVMGINWMEWDELTQAIPPVYTEWLGNQLIQGLAS